MPTGKKKICLLCKEKTNYVDYKNLKVLRKYVSQHVKIQPRYYTGVCLNHQKKLARAIKNARFIGLLPYIKR